MGEVLPLPAVGDIFLDVRGDDRTMRVSSHLDQGVVVVSLWAGPVCRGSFRLAGDDVGRLLALLSGIVSPPAQPMAPDDTATAAGAETSAVAPAPSAPSPEQTGDVSMSGLRTVPVPRVA